MTRPLALIILALAAAAAAQEAEPDPNDPSTWPEFPTGYEQATDLPEPAYAPARATLEALPAEFDWREARGFNPAPRSQGSSQACWTFAANGSVEAVASYQLRALVDLSELYPAVYAHSGIEQPGDYVTALRLYTTGDNNKCPAPGGEFGAVLNEDYWFSYPDRTRHCPDPFTHYYRVTGWDLLPGDAGSGNPRLPAPETIMSAVMEFGPVTTSIVADNRLMQYRERPETPFFVGTKGMDPRKRTNHAVAILGWTRVEGVLCWIIWNSWPSYWGAGDGYALIEAGANLIGVNTTVVYGVEQIRPLPGESGPDAEPTPGEIGVPAAPRNETDYGPAGEYGAEADVIALAWRIGGPLGAVLLIVGAAFGAARMMGRVRR